MSNDSSNKLFKQDMNSDSDNRGSSEQSVLWTSVSELSKVCRSLSVSTNEYEPQDTMFAVASYIEKRGDVGRVLYSEISSYLFSLDRSKRGVFISNLQKLVDFSYKEHSTLYDNKKCEDIVTRIYDHAMLANQQIEMANQIYYNNIDETQREFDRHLEMVTSELKADNKKIQKEYITILGIFAAISLTFIGELTFSASVLQNMHLVSIYRLVLVIDMLALIFSNMLYFLTKFIAAINSKEKSNFNFASKIIKCINISCLVVCVITILLRVFDFTGFVNYISGLLPWG